MFAKVKLTFKAWTRVKLLFIGQDQKSDEQSILRSPFFSNKLILGAKPFFKRCPNI